MLAKHRLRVAPLHAERARHGSLLVEEFALAYLMIINPPGRPLGSSRKRILLVATAV